MRVCRYWGWATSPEDVIAAYQATGGERGMAWYGDTSSGTLDIIERGEVLDGGRSTWEVVAHVESESEAIGSWTDAAGRVWIIWRGLVGPDEQEVYWLEGGSTYGVRAGPETAWAPDPDGEEPEPEPEPEPEERLVPPYPTQAARFGWIFDEDAWEWVPYRPPRP